MQVLYCTSSWLNALWKPQYVQGKLKLDGQVHPSPEGGKVPADLFFIPVVEVEVEPLVPHCRRSLVAPSVRNALPSFQSEPRLLQATVRSSPSTSDIQPGSGGSSRRSFVPQIDQLLAAKCLTTVPTRIGMPLEDSWNHFGSPLSKAECLSCQVCYAAHDYLLTRHQADRNQDVTELNLYLPFATLCSGLQRKIHASCFL